jgi:hypothetical protein
MQWILRHVSPMAGWDPVAIFVSTLANSKVTVSGYAAFDILAEILDRQYYSSLRHARCTFLYLSIDSHVSTKAIDMPSVIILFVYHLFLIPDRTPSWTLSRSTLWGRMSHEDGSSGPGV